MPDSHYNDWANDASVAQSVVHLTRNEKVACSSQVTSSTKAVTLEKSGGFCIHLKKKLCKWKPEIMNLLTQKQLCI